MNDQTILSSNPKSDNQEVQWFVFETRIRKIIKELVEPSTKQQKELKQSVDSLNVISDSYKRRLDEHEFVLSKMQKRTANFDELSKRMQENETERKVLESKLGQEIASLRNHNDLLREKIRVTSQDSEQFNKLTTNIQEEVRRYQEALIDYKEKINTSLGTIHQELSSQLNDQKISLLEYIDSSSLIESKMKYFSDEIKKIDVNMETQKIENKKNIEKCTKKVGKYQQQIDDANHGIKEIEKQFHQQDRKINHFGLENRKIMDENQRTDQYLSLFLPITMLNQITEVLHLSLKGSSLNRVIKYEHRKYKELEDRINHGNNGGFSKLEYKIPIIPDFVEESEQQSNKKRRKSSGVTSQHSEGSNNMNLFNQQKAFNNNSKQNQQQQQQQDIGGGMSCKNVMLMDKNDQQHSYTGQNVTPYRGTTPVHTQQQHIDGKEEDQPKIEVRKIDSHAVPRGNNLILEQIPMKHGSGNHLTVAPGSNSNNAPKQSILKSVSQFMQQNMQDQASHQSLKMRLSKQGSTISRHSRFTFTKSGQNFHGNNEEDRSLHLNKSVSSFSKNSYKGNQNNNDDHHYKNRDIQKKDSSYSQAIGDSESNQDENYKNIDNRKQKGEILEENSSSSSSVKTSKSASQLNSPKPKSVKTSQSLLRKSLTKRNTQIKVSEDLIDQRIEEQREKWLIEDYERQREIAEMIVENQITEMAEQIDQKMDIIEQRFEMFTKAIEMSSSGFEQALQYKEKELVQNFEDFRVSIEGEMTRRARQKNDMQLDKEKMLNQIADLQQVLKQVCDQTKLNAESLTCLIENQQIQGALDLQEEIDKEAVALYGRDQNQEQVTASLLDNARHQISIGISTKKDAPSIQLDQNCISCSGNNQHIIKTFKLACLAYKSSDIRYKGTKMNRKTLLSMKTQMIQQLINKLYSHEPYASLLNENDEMYIQKKDCYTTTAFKAHHQAKLQKLTMADASFNKISNSMSIDGGMSLTQLDAMTNGILNENKSYLPTDQNGGKRESLNINFQTRNLSKDPYELMTPFKYSTQVGERSFSQMGKINNNSNKPTSRDQEDFSALNSVYRSQTRTAYGNFNISSSLKKTKQPNFDDRSSSLGGKLANSTQKNNPNTRNNIVDQGLDQFMVTGKNQNISQTRGNRSPLKPIISTIQRPFKNADTLTNDNYQ